MKFFARQNRSAPAARTTGQAYASHLAAHPGPAKPAEGKLSRHLWFVFLMGVVFAAAMLAAEVGHTLPG